MFISNRIKEIVSEVKFKRVADIGTDHGYISIHCAETKHMEKIIACDINKEPLLNCISNLEKYNLSDIVETRLGSGLSRIKKNEVDTIIIAGMGGGLIIDILNDDIDITKSVSQLILSPQSNIPKVRKYIHSIGFKITNEKIIYEDSFYYNIIVCEIGTDCKYTESDYYLGKILLEKKDVIFLKSCNEQLKKLIYLKNNIIKNAKDYNNIKDKIEELDSKISILENYIG